MQRTKTGIRLTGELFALADGLVKAGNPLDMIKPSGNQDGLQALDITQTNLFDNFNKLLMFEKFQGTDQRRSTYA